MLWFWVHFIFIYQFFFAFDDAHQSQFFSLVDCMCGCVVICGFFLISSEYVGYAITEL